MTLRQRSSYIFPEGQLFLLLSYPLYLNYACEFYFDLVFMSAYAMQL